MRENTTKRFAVGDECYLIHYGEVFKGKVSELHKLGTVWSVTFHDPNYIVDGVPSGLVGAVAYEWRDGWTDPAKPPIWFHGNRTPVFREKAEADKALEFLKSVKPLPLFLEPCKEPIIENTEERKARDKEFEEKFRESVHGFNFGDTVYVIIGGNVTQGVVRSFDTTSIGVRCPFFKVEYISDDGQKNIWAYMYADREWADRYKEHRVPMFCNKEDCENALMEIWGEVPAHLSACLYPDHERERLFNKARVNKVKECAREIDMFCFNRGYEATSSNTSKCESCPFYVIFDGEEKKCIFKSLSPTNWIACIKDSGIR